MQSSDDRWSLPAPSHVSECITRWRKLDLRESTDDEIEKSLLELRDSIGSCLVQRTTKRFPRLWRVRRNGRRYDRVQDFWCPPSNLTKQGRCNRPGEPLLYASPYAITAFDEMKAESGDLMVLTEYRSMRNLRLDRVVGFSDPNPVEGPRVLEGDDLAAFQLLRKFIEDEFTRDVTQGDEHQYRLSAALCRMWTNSDCADGWIYPSVQNPRQENVAIKPAASDVCLEVKRACLVKVLDNRIHRSKIVSPGPGIVLEVLDTASVTKNRVTWTGKTGFCNFYRS